MADGVRAAPRPKVLLLAECARKPSRVPQRKPTQDPSEPRKSRTTLPDGRKVATARDGALPANRPQWRIRAQLVQVARRFLVEVAGRLLAATTTLSAQPSTREQAALRRRHRRPLPAFHGCIRNMRCTPAREECPRGPHARRGRGGKELPTTPGNLLTRRGAGQGLTFLPERERSFPVAAA